MRTLHADHLLQRLQCETEGALHHRLFICLRAAIVEGVWLPNSRLPATRDLAQELSVSRNTVINAYEHLLAEGYVSARIGSGTRVAATLPESYLNAAKMPFNEQGDDVKNVTLSRRGVDLLNAAGVSPHQWGAFVPGVPDVTQFPHALFSRLYAKFSRAPDHERLIYDNQGGCEVLRTTLADYLRETRSVRCDAEQILITEGVHQAVDLVSRMLCDIGDRAWIEDPCYWGIRNIMRINGLDVISMPVDHEGMNPDPDVEKAPPRIIMVTPSHQYPLGSHLSLARRRQLLEMARRYQSVIVEDDYDNEFRFSGQPFPSLQGLEADAPVVYIGTFSKTLYPGLRIGYMVVPKTLIGPLRAAAAELYRSGHLLVQRTLAEFIIQGHYAAHIRRMRLLYGRRHAFLVDLIKRYLGEHFLHEFNQDAGLHLVVKLPQSCDDLAIASQAVKRGVKVRALSPYYWQTQQQPQRGLILGFACVEEKAMFDALCTLRNCLLDAGVSIDK
ncbi:PLP-dependent aminotransferase family protein [Rouxiella sp. Mn2063]|uniref:MocR-like pyridoxine biosynthesis transcription factor PdxR n=1 Tax=Rouxiella sp. Mn2063 TaxID=3395262 RepID=UPI003BEEAD11